MLITAICWYWFKNPLKTLYRGWQEPILLQDNAYEESDGPVLRNYHDIVLDAGPYGTATFTVSLPKEMPQQGVPCGIVVDGLDTGRKCLQLAKNHGDYALLAFEYPAALHAIKKKSVLLQVFKVRKAALNVPGQLIAIMDWVQKQPWHDGGPISMMGFSFGSEFVPAAYSLAKMRGISLHPIVFAYGGAGLFRLFYAFKGNFFAKCLRAILGAFVFRPLEPVSHLHTIDTEVLLISGTQDEIVSFSAAEKMQRLLHDPKTVINLETVHLKPENRELLSQIVKIARDWVEERIKARGNNLPRAM